MDAPLDTIFISDELDKPKIMVILGEGKYD
jgi:hypothetical protein